MPALTIRIGGAGNRAKTARLFLWLAVAIVCVSLIATFRLGVERGLRDTIGNESWGRILFGVGTAITQMDHGGYGYALSTVIETILTYGGLTDDPRILAPFADDARRRASNDGMIGYVGHDQRCCTDHRAATDAEIGKDRRVCADRGARPHDRSQHLPIGLALEVAFCCGGVRVKVVDKLHAVANEDLIFDLYAFTNEAMR